MNDQALQQLIDGIDALPVDEAPRAHTFGVKPDPRRYLYVTANQAGLIQLARTCLVAAISPIELENGARPITVDEPLDQALDGPDDAFIGWIHRTDVVPISDEIQARRRAKAWRSDRLALLGCGLVGSLLMFLLVSGVLLWGAIITGKADWLP